MLDITKPETFTDQGIFDYVVAKLAEQGKRSRISYEGCKYHGPGGTKCAVGHIIPDDLYIPEMDQNHGYSISRLIECEVFRYLKPYMGLLYDLQKAHDVSIDAEEIRDNLKIVAQAHMLKSCMIDKMTVWS